MSIRISQSPYDGMWETVVDKIIELLNKRFEKGIILYEFMRSRPCL